MTCDCYTCQHEKVKHTNNNPDCKCDVCQHKHMTPYQIKHFADVAKACKQRKTPELDDKKYALMLIQSCVNNFDLHFLTKLPLGDLEVLVKGYLHQFELFDKILREARLAVMNSLIDNSNLNVIKRDKYCFSSGDNNSCYMHMDIRHERLENCGTYKLTVKFQRNDTNILESMWVKEK